MSKPARVIVLTSIAAACIVFLIVQDRITAAGAREYVARQRSAELGRTPAVTIEEIMRPAVRRSVRTGLVWGGVVLLTGLAAAAAVNRWHRQPD